jgi:phage shock protein PspC (stress-responsive transcriptional regulator)
LYQISEGAIVSGLCNGIAAYSALDVTLVRAIFVAIILLTGGAALLGYLILMFVVPYASTSEEHAAARGLPFNARELVERAKLKYAQFAGGSDWRRSRAAWRKDWKRTRAQWRAHWRYGSAPPFPAPAPATPAGHAARVAAGALVAILGIGLALFTVGWLIALLSLVMTGAILGWVLPQDVPLWVGIGALIFLYYLVVWPIKTLRHLAYTPRFGYHVNWVAPWDGLVGLAIVATLIWYGYHHVPEVHSFLDHLQRL